VDSIYAVCDSGRELKKDNKPEDNINTDLTKNFSEILKFFVILTIKALSMELCSSNFDFFAYNAKKST